MKINLDLKLAHKLVKEYITNNGALDEASFFFAVRYPAVFSGEEISDLFAFDFTGFEVSQLWKRIDKFLTAKFGVKIYAISSLDPTQSAVFGSEYAGKNEYVRLGLQNESGEVIIFDDDTYDLRENNKEKSAYMLSHFLQKVCAIHYIDRLAPKFTMGSSTTQSWDFVETYNEMQRDMI